MSEQTNWIILIVFAGVAGLMGYAVRCGSDNIKNYHRDFYESCFSEHKKYECDALYGSATQRGVPQ